MKNIFKSLMMVLSGAMLFASCQEEAAPLASAITVDKQELTFAGTSAEAQKVKVKADGDWFVLSSEEWVTVTPNNGNGETDVTITVADNVDSYNELAGPRSTVVNFCYGTTGVTPVTVKQSGEAGLDASRTYSLVTKQEDIVAGSYLIVFKNAGKHIALEPLVASKTYGYLNAVEVTPENDVITMSNAYYAFTLEAAETGYNMVMSDNRYIFMKGGYNSFNVSADKADSNPWTLTLNEDGTVNITAVTHGNYIQYSTTHSSAGAYTSPQDGGLMPYLYKDSKAKSDEVLSVKDVVVSPRATEATIKVTSNKTWKVRNHDEWIKSFTPAGEGNGEIKVTFDAYTSTTADRTASFTIIGETTNFVVELKQLMVPAKSAVDELALDKYCGVEGVVVAAGNDGGYVLADETGPVFVYQKNHGRAVGDKLYVEGNVLRSSGYNTNPVQITPMYTEEISKNNAWTYNPKALDGAALDALVGKDADCEEVLVKGKLTVSGKYVNLVVNGASKQGSIKYMLAADYADLNGAYVVVKGYTVGTYNYLNILPYSVEVDPDVLPDPEVVKSVPYSESFASGKGDFTLDGDDVWSHNSSYGYMMAKAYINNVNTASEAWLISPGIDLTSINDACLSFDQTGRYFGTMKDEATLWVRAFGEGWTQLTIPNYMGGTSWTWVNSGAIDLSAYAGKKIQFAFKYTSTTSAAGTWEVKNIKVESKATEPEQPETPEPGADVKTLTNAEICAAMTSSSTSYVDYTIQSESGVWTVNASQYKDNTFLQCRGKKGAYIKTPAFEKDIKSVTIHFTTAKSVYSNNVYCVFPSTWTAPTADAAYPETGHVGRAVTDDSYSLTIPVDSGNKQVYVSIIGTYSYYLDHIDVAF